MTKNNQLKIDYLAFADDIDLITSTINYAQTQLLELQKQVAKPHMAIEKAEFLTRIKEA